MKISKKTKKILAFGGVAVIATVMAFESNMRTNGSNMGLIMQNTEALALGEDNDCTNTNGYKQFITVAGYNAYDCCSVWREGVGADECN